VEDDAPAHVVRVRAWGFWRLEITTSFSQAIVSECRAASPPVGLLIDATRLLPQRNEGQAAFSELMTASRTLGLTAVAIVVSSSITRMQLLRIAKETGARDWAYFSPGQEAMATLVAAARQPHLIRR
jgi:hypothetical protein